MRFFDPQGRHVAPMGVKFGMEEGTEGYIQCLSEKTQFLSFLFRKQGSAESIDR